MENFQQQQQQQQLIHQNQAVGVGGVQGPIQFHPIPPHHQSAHPNNNRNDNQLQSTPGNIGQLRNNSLGAQNNNIDPSIQIGQKFPLTNNGGVNTNQNANGISNLRPISRGDLATQRANVQNNLVQNNTNGTNNSTYHIHNDQQTFQLPAGSMPGAQPFQYTGGPGALPNQSQQNASNQMQPQFHFIANQQKFYAQISPDKAPFLFSEKRPFTAADQLIGMGGGIIAASQQINENQSHPQQQQQNQQQQQHSSQTRGNSKNGSTSKSGRVNNMNHGQQKSGGQAILNPIPYLQMASKTHTGAFPLQQMQMAATQGQKYVSSTGQLLQDSQPGQNQSGNPHHLISIFQQPGQQPPNSQTLQNMMNQQNNNHIKVSKIKPGKNSIKEKEQLYEDAIKLKIQSNSYREENIKLKTKIKILENEMLKKDKAMEDFLAKMSLNQASGLPGGGSTSSAHQTSTMFYQPLPNNSKHQMPANINGVTSNPPNLSNINSNSAPSNVGNTHPLNNNFMSASSQQKFQSETFLVMSLKKQLKDAKMDILKRDEELDVLKKNIKTTQKVETEVELKTYQDELQRMRFLMEELMKEGPNHPIYQKQALDKIRLLEAQLQQQEYMNNQLRQDNTDLANLVRLKEEEKDRKKEEKEKKVELKNELIKVKKSLREKEKEVTKLKQDINSLRRQLAVSGNANGTANSNTNTTDHSSNATTGGGVNNISTNKTGTTTEDKRDTSNSNTTNATTSSTDNQVKSLQKKNRDLMADLKLKKEKLEEQDQVVKKLQERLQGKMDELIVEQKKLKILQEEIEVLKKEKELKLKEEKRVLELKQKYNKELDFMRTLAQSQGVVYENLINKREFEKNIPQKIAEELKDMRNESLKEIIAPYQLITPLQDKIFKQIVAEILLPKKAKLLEACDLELHEDGDQFIKFGEFSDALQSADIKIGEGKESILMDYLKVKYFTKIDRKGFESDIGFLFQKLLSDIDTLNYIQSQPKQQPLEQQRVRPQTAKSNKSQAQSQQQKSQMDLKQIQEDLNEKEEEEDQEQVDEDYAENDYEEDFEDSKPTPQIKNKSKKTTTATTTTTKTAAIESKINKTSDKINTSVGSNKIKKQNTQKVQQDKDSEPIQPSIKDKSADQQDSKEVLLSGGLDSAKKLKRSRSIDGGSQTVSPGLDDKQEKDHRDTEGTNPMEDRSEIKQFMNDEEMLDIAEHCFIRIAEMLLECSRTTRSVFTKYSVPEQFPDGTILDLMSPIAFLEAVKEAGMEELSEMEAACLLRVLAKPELDNAIILNEFIMIMENFGVLDNYEEDDDDDDYIRTDDETLTDINNASKVQLEEDKDKEKNGKVIDMEEKKGNNDNKEDADDKTQDKTPSKSVGNSTAKPSNLKKKKKISINFDLLEEKGLKILRKLARFLLERYLHPREFFGPAIYKQLVKTKKRENHVDILQTKDFYLRLKIAGVRKSIKEVENLNKFLCLDAKFPNLMQVKRVIKALEEVAQGEQVKLQEEMMRRQEELMKKQLTAAGGAIVEEENEDEETDGDIGEDEKKARKAAAKEEGSKLGNNLDLIRETGGGVGLMPHSAVTGGPSGYGGYLGGSYDYPGMRGGAANSVHSSKIQMLMGFNHLNTIEEEKHETQNSAYFRDGDESHREDSKYMGGGAGSGDHSNFIGMGSRILDDLDASTNHKQSPPKEELHLEEEEDQYEEEEDEEAEEDADKKSNVDADRDNEEYEEDDDQIEEEHNPQLTANSPVKSIQDMKSVEDDHDKNEIEDDIDDNFKSNNTLENNKTHLNKSKQQIEESTDKQVEQKQQQLQLEAEDEYEEEESDYEI